MANAVNNAMTNALRKKGKKAIPLWKKKQKRLNKKVAKANLNLVEMIEAKDGKSWVDAIYKANGLELRKGVKHG